MYGKKRKLAVLAKGMGKAFRKSLYRSGLGRTITLKTDKPLSTSSRAVFRNAKKPVVFRNSYEVDLTGNATGSSGTGFGYSFKFDDITDVTDIMNLYDQYRILLIEVTFLPTWNIAGNSSNALAPMYLAFDPANSSAPANAAEMLNYSNVKIKSINKRWRMKFTPCMYQSIGVTTSNEYSLVKTSKLWLTNTDTLARGLRIWVDPINVNSAPIGKLIFTYSIAAKFQS